MNWFKYRLPNSTEIVSGASESLVEGLGEGFAFAPFSNPECGITTIPADFIPEKKDLKTSLSSLPPTTSQQDYFCEIKAIKAELNENRGKTVAARVINIDLKIDINATFDSLCDSYPDAFVFAFSTYSTGTWIGASPELLLKKEGLSVSTIALAGTRPASETSQSIEWDEKNVDEQEMVAEFIYGRLNEICTNVNIHQTYTKRAGKIEHICTPISALLPNSDISTLKQLLIKLSPTPAVGGSDRTRSIQLISAYEHFDREMYGGFCGPSDLNGNTAFYVILRSAKCSEKGISIFAGGGITPLSIFEEEWNETEMKSKTIINKLITSEE